MKRPLIYFLAFVTFWMSTWMVTDIHDESIAEKNQLHPVFSVQSTQTDSQLPRTDSDPVNDNHCSVCSYDHGGHIGQMLAAVSYQPVFNPVLNQPSSLPSDFWYSRPSSPTLRPPII